MPQALAFIAPATFAAGGSAALITAAGTLTIAGAGVSIGGGLLLNLGLAALGQSSDSADPENVKLNLQQSIGPRVKHVGRVQVGGTVVFYRTSGGKFYRLIVHGHGQIDAIETYILNNQPVTLDVDGFVEEPQYEVGGRKLVQILTRLGLPDSTYYGKIEEVWPEWDSTHKLNGLATSLTIAEAASAENQRAVYPNNEPSLQLVLRGARLRDPRIPGVAWSQNAALAIADLIEDPDFINKAGAVDDPTLIEAADDSDDGIPLAAGGTEPRFAVSGSYALTESPGAVLERLLAVCNGEVRLLPNGKAGIYVGKWVPPTVVLRRDELLEIIEAAPGPDKLDRYNELPFVHVDPALGFRRTTGDTWVDATRQADDNGQLVAEERDWSLIPSHTQGRRVAQWQTEVDNPAIIMVGRFRPSALRALYERWIEFDLPELGGLYWRVAEYDLNLTTGALTFTLASFAPPIWSTAFEGTAVSLPDPASEGFIPTPANVRAYGAGLSAFGGGGAGIAVAWTAPDSAALTPEVQYSEANAEDWVAVVVAETATQVQILTPTDGDSYDVRVRFVTFDGLRSAWVQVSDVVSSTDTSTPAAPTGLAVTNLTGGQASVSLTTSSSANLWRTILLRGGVQVATSFALPSTAVTIIDPSGAGSFTWTARSVAVSKRSATSAGVTQTIT
jgi:hypothetical protein